MEVLLSHPRTSEQARAPEEEALHALGLEHRVKLHPVEVAPVDGALLAEGQPLLLHARQVPPLFLASVARVSSRQVYHSDSYVKSADGGTSDTGLKFDLNNSNRAL